MKVSIQAIGLGGEANSFGLLNSFDVWAEQFRLGIGRAERLDAVAIAAPRAELREALQVAEEKVFLKSVEKLFIK